MTPLFETLKAKAFTLGRTGSHDDIYKALHEAACDDIDELLISHPEATDADREALLLKYKDGFWEDTETESHKTLRAALRDLLDCPDLNLGNLEAESLEAIAAAEAALAA